MALTTAAVKDEWGRRALAEHGSAAATAELLTWLLFENASPALITACHRIVADEVAHAALSLDVLAAAGGDADSLARQRTATSSPHERDAPPLWRALAVVSSLFCCGETVAVPLFKAMHTQAKRPIAKRVLGRILRDEGRHRAFGWAALDELLGKTGDAGRAFVQARVDGYVDVVRRGYSAPEIDVHPRERAWGLMPASSYIAAVDACVAGEIAPRFAARGITVATVAHAERRSVIGLR